MPCQHDDKKPGDQAIDFTRRKMLQMAAASSAALALPRELLASLSQQSKLTDAADKRFPYFRSVPVSYFHVRFQDGFWARRQESTREISIPWITKAHDSAGGVEGFKAHPHGYRA